MKAKYFNFLGACLLFLAGCTAGESYVNSNFDFSRIDRIAVVDVQGNIGGAAAENQIADFFAMELLKKGYSPVERAQVSGILKEQEFQASDLTTPQGVARAGRILNVPTVILVNIPTFNEEINMTVKMLDVESGEILWMGSGFGTTGRTLSTIAGAAAGAAVGAATTGKGDQVIGGIAGGVLGGAGGRALSPQKSQKVKEIIKKICATLPYRQPLK